MRDNSLTISIFGQWHRKEPTLSFPLKPFAAINIKKSHILCLPSRNPTFSELTSLILGTAFFRTVFTNNILSMAQQVFLQKSGVTKNPVSKFSDNIIKNEEQSQIQKSIFETSTIIKEPQVEKSTSEGLRPGERLLALPKFKQLKEQEARRRQQREEEKKKAEEAAANVTQTNGAHEKEAISVQGESGDEVESSDSKNGSPNSLTGMTNSSSTDYRVVNGNVSNLDSKEDQRTSGLLLNRVIYVFGVASSFFLPKKQLLPRALQITNFLAKICIREEVSEGWKSKLLRVDSVVYLVDAYDKERFAEAKKELDALHKKEQ
ncbi:unnamed protein product [Camellia sinensis]